MTSGFKSFVAPPPFTTVHYQAMESGGVGLSKKAWSLPDPLVGSWKTLAQLWKEEFDVLTLECEKLSMFVLLEGLGQRCPCALQCWLLLCVETKFLVLLTLQCSASHSCSLEQSSTTREGCRNTSFIHTLQINYLSRSFHPCPFRFGFRFWGHKITCLLQKPSDVWVWWSSPWWCGFRKQHHLKLLQCLLADFAQFLKIFTWKRLLLKISIGMMWVPIKVCHVPIIFLTGGWATRWAEVGSPFSCCFRCHGG